MSIPFCLSVLTMMVVIQTKLGLKYGVLEDSTKVEEDNGVVEEEAEGAQYIGNIGHLSL